MNDEPSIARFREAQERRAEERHQYRAQIAAASNIREYLDIQRANSSPQQQTEANVGYSNVKRR